MDELRRAEELDPHNAEIFIEKAYAYYGLGKRNEAETSLQQAISVEPNYYKPHLDAGYYYSLQGNYTLAEQHWLTAVRMAPAQNQARVNLAELYMSQGRPADAERMIVESLEIRKTGEGLAQLAVLQEQRGDLKQAVSTYEEAIRIGPPPFRIWAQLGGAYRKQSRPEEATRAFQQGLALTQQGVRSYPREPDRVAWCAYYYANLGDIRATRESAAQALSMAPTPSAEVCKLLVLACDRVHDRKEVLRLLAGASPDVLAELARSPELSNGLRRDPTFRRLTHR